MFAVIMQITASLLAIWLAVIIAQSRLDQHFLQSTEGEDISRLLDSEDDLNAITIENPAVDQFKSSVVNKDCKITNIAIDQCVSQSSGGSSLTYCTCTTDYCNNAVLIKASLIASLLFFLAFY